MPKTSRNSISPLTSEHSFADQNSIDRMVAYFVGAALSKNTIKAYDADVQHFLAWGGAIPATPRVLAQYLASHSRELSVATLSRRVVSLGRAHVQEGFVNPAKSQLVTDTLRGIRNIRGRPQRRVSPLLTDDLRALAAKTGCSLAESRNIALILLGFAAALRRSELVSLDCESILSTRCGLNIHLARTKNDRERHGKVIAVSRSPGVACPVNAINNWLLLSGIKNGAVFRPITASGQLLTARLSARAVSAIVKKAAANLGLKPDNYSGHSLRCGFVSSAAMAGIPVWRIRKQTGHASDQMVYRYIRDAELFVDNSLGGLL